MLDFVLFLVAFFFAPIAILIVVRLLVIEPVAAAITWSVSAVGGLVFGLFCVPFVVSVAFVLACRAGRQELRVA